MLEHPKDQDANGAKIPDMKTMGNQQATSIDLAWLAGIWDGEGTISVRRSMKINQFSPRVSVVNSNAAMLNRICDLLDILDVRYHMFEKTHYPSAGIQAKRQIWAISVETLANAAKLLNAIHPYLVAKKEQSLLLMRFINSRLSRIAKVKRMNDAPYSEEELDWLARIRDENGDQRKSSEAIRTSAAKIRRMGESQAQLPIC